MAAPSSTILESGDLLSPPPPRNELTPNSSSNLNVGAAIGGSIGGFIVLVLLAATPFILAKRRRKREREFASIPPMPIALSPLPHLSRPANPPEESKRIPQPMHRVFQIDRGAPSQVLPAVAAGDMEIHEAPAVGVVAKVHELPTPANSPVQARPGRDSPTLSQEER
ncbi:hypothetical protein B0T17DRAFT_618196 [Bombardia bombarda]|uniref:Uncharacterized protein n=1 Tax=Bombardia bombarda TaxID=252184 RepID=A0AA39WUD8_9PEZI|nr:hypothetical protein B0T17DRAFT_618196 [Bombardia bombarda]